MMCLWWILVFTTCLVSSGARAQSHQNVSITRLQLSLEEIHELLVDTNVEYILDFNPNEEQAQWPLRVWIYSEGGHPTRPLLITYRQRAGAGTWQLPRALGSRLQYELERTLCADNQPPADAPGCEGSDEAVGWVSLHVVAVCAARVRVRVAPARDFHLPFDQPITTTATLWSPRVHMYSWAEGQQQVRLLATSDDDVCATLSVQPPECPIAETLEELSATTLGLTMQRSGAVQIARSRFPRGFLVVGIVRENDFACGEPAPEGDDWLWESAVLGDAPAPPPPPPRVKQIHLHTAAALSRAQYVVAAVVTLAVFLAFYVSFGVIVLMQRWPPFAKYVSPKAVLADNAETTLQSQADTARDRSTRRDSTATFDSSDISDSDESEVDTRSPVVGRGRPHDGRRTDMPPGTGTADLTTPDTVTSNLQSPDRTTTYPPGTDVSPTREGAVTDGVTFADAERNGRVDVNGAQSVPPWGLPSRLVVAALSRRRGRVIRARADRYLTTLLTVAVFYALPVLQFVFTFQIFLNFSGSLDVCYYNFLCAHPAGMVSDFNHVFSNLGYLLLGALFMLQLRRRQRRRDAKPRHEEYGIPAHYGLLAALGAGMMVVALLSATYHICPNRLNFQFDTSFMYVLAVLSMVKIYQSRHPDVNARAHATFGVLAVLIALVVWGVLGGGAFFWGVFTVLHVFTFLLLSLHIYYLGQFRFEKETIQRAARQLRDNPGEGLRPLYTARLVMVLLGNAVNWAIALYGLFQQSADFASHLLYVLLGNTLLYMCFYLTMKLLHGERPRWYAWAFTIGAAACWAPALYMFTTGSSSWSSSAAQSRHLNHECRVLQFYDSHDLWHLLSAVALYLSFNAMLTWDDGLSAVPRTQIAVF